MAGFCCRKLFHDGKTVVDVGCGNGRIGRLVAPFAREYIGLDLSDSVYAFPDYLETTNITLVQASGTNLPLKDSIGDVTICWGVLHHMDKPMQGLEELIRVTKPGGMILIFIYSKGYQARQNFNQFSKIWIKNSSHELLESTSDFLDTWREVDEFYANNLSHKVFLWVLRNPENGRFFSGTMASPRSSIGI